MRHASIKAAAAAFALAASLAGASVPGGVTVRNYFGTHTFLNPVHVEQVPGRDSAYLVLEQAGNIMAVEWDGTTWVKTLFAQMPALGPAHDNGLLGLAFHPAFEENLKYYVYYTAHPAPGVSKLEERRVDSVLLRDAGGPPLRTLLSVPQPHYWHAGGTLGFGRDGFLYLGLGDGGDHGDPGNRAQDPGEILGKFLRLDVDAPDAFPDDTTRNYGVPHDNPFVGHEEYAPEIWALGLRNPWKWSFHPSTGEIWAGDVGENHYEKISVIHKGSNHGWRIREGLDCFPRRIERCEATGFSSPILPLPHGGRPSAVIGGVFFDDPTAAFHDIYIYGNYSTGRIYGARFTQGALTDTAMLVAVPAVSTVNRDRQGHILAAALNQGMVYHLVAPGMLPGTAASLRPGAAARLMPITRAELLRDRHRFVLRGLDGRTVEGLPPGVFLVYEKGGSGAPRLFHNLRGGD